MCRIAVSLWPECWRDVEEGSTLCHMLRRALWILPTASHVKRNSAPPPIGRSDKLTESLIWMMGPRCLEKSRIPLWTHAADHDYLESGGLKFIAGPWGENPDKSLVLSFPTKNGCHALYCVTATAGNFGTSTTRQCPTAPTKSPFDFGRVTSLIVGTSR